jgi:hypothetical protein
MQQYIAQPQTPVLIHGDINIMNIMADPKSMHLTGFIDPSEAIWAAREYGLFQLQNMWGNHFGLYEAYKAQHKLPPHSDFVIACYGAINESRAWLTCGMQVAAWQCLWNQRLKKALQEDL